MGNFQCVLFNGALLTAPLVKDILSHMLCFVIEGGCRVVVGDVLMIWCVVLANQVHHHHQRREPFGGALPFLCPATIGLYFEPFSRPRSVQDSGGESLM